MRCTRATSKGWCPQRQWILHCFSCRTLPYSSHPGNWAKDSYIFQIKTLWRLHHSLMFWNFQWTTSVMVKWEAAFKNNISPRSRTSSVMGIASSFQKSHICQNPFGSCYNIYCLKIMACFLLFQLACSVCLAIFAEFHCFPKTVNQFPLFVWVFHTTHRRGKH